MFNSALIINDSRSQERAEKGSIIKHTNHLLNENKSNNSCNELIKFIIINNNNSYNKCNNYQNEYDSNLSAKKQ